jgi:opacity protein-like surface antigen
MCFTIAGLHKNSKKEDDMKRLIPCTIVIALVFCLCQVATAQIKNSGPYIGGGIGYAWETMNTDELDKVADRVTVNDAWGFNLFAGYRFYEYLAVETNFNWYDSFEIDTNLGSGDLDIITLMLDAKVMYPLFDKRIVPYARIGLGWMFASLDAGDEDNLAWNFGGGIDYFITPNISIGLDAKYVMGTADLDDIEYLVGSINAAYHF